MPLQAAIFDFDLTLTVEHVFNLLAGGPPQAMSEAGQLARIAELDQSPEYRGQGGFATAMFGGTTRISQIHEMLTTLRRSGVNCLVCTRGLVGPVRKQLEQVELLGHFSGVYGNTGETYGMAEYDHSANPGADVRFLAGPECQLPGSKSEFVQGYLNQKGLRFLDAVFIDDTMEEIVGMTSTCQTIHVNTRGMTSQTFAEILRLLPVAQACEAPLPPLISLNPQVANQNHPTGQASFLDTRRSQFAQVWSNGHQAWCPAVVVGRDGPMIHVNYDAPNGQQFSKSLPEGCPELRLQDHTHVEEKGNDSDSSENPMCELGSRRRDKRGRKQPCCHQ